MLQVPAHVSAKQLEVVIEPYLVKVTNKVTQEVYLSGTLERGVVPKESVWMHGGGAGEDGFLLLLHKMNLELLARYACQSFSCTYGSKLDGLRAFCKPF